MRSIPRGPRKGKFQLINTIKAGGEKAVRLSGALEEFACPGECYRLIQHPLADAEVFGDPFVHLGILARYTLAPDAAAGQIMGHGQRLLLFLFSSSGRLCSELPMGTGNGGSRVTHVRPVERRMPARMVETVREKGGLASRKAEGACGPRVRGATY